MTACIRGKSSTCRAVLCGNDASSRHVASQLSHESATNDLATKPFSIFWVNFSGPWPWIFQGRCVTRNKFYRRSHSPSDISIAAQSLRPGAQGAQHQLGHKSWSATFQLPVNVYITMEHGWKWPIRNFASFPMKNAWWICQVRFT